MFLGLCIVLLVFRIIFQAIEIKEQDKTPEKELNKMETCNLPGKEFKGCLINLIEEKVSVRILTNRKH